MPLDPTTAAIAATFGYEQATATEAEQPVDCACIKTTPATQAQAGFIGCAVGWPLYQWRGELYAVPTYGEIEEMAFDSVAFNPDGDDVEPDAPDSWLSILGLI